MTEQEMTNEQSLVEENARLRQLLLLQSRLIRDYEAYLRKIVSTRDVKYEAHLCMLTQLMLGEEETK